VKLVILNFGGQVRILKVFVDLICVLKFA
jgi:hypothetical protein